MGHVVMVVGPVDRHGDIFVGMETWLANRLHHDLRSLEASVFTSDIGFRVQGLRLEGLGLRVYACQGLGRSFRIYAFEAQISSTSTQCSSGSSGSNGSNGKQR